MINKEFNVRQDVGGTAIGGSSMGGLAALYGHFRWSHVFGAALCMSPSLWFADRKIYEFIAAMPPPWSSQVYIDAGAHEGPMLQDAEQLVAHLRSRGYDDAGLMWRADPYGKHSEHDWRNRAPSALEFLFSGQRGEYRGTAIDDELHQAVPVQAA